MNDWLVVLLVVALVVAGLSATAETSLTSVSRIWLRARRADGDRRAAQVERLQANPGGYLGTILVTNTLALVLASSAATLLAEKHLGARSGALVGGGPSPSWCCSSASWDPRPTLSSTTRPWPGFWPVR